MKPVPILSVMALCFLVACSKKETVQPVTPATPVTKDCVPGSSGCTEIQVSGDAYATPASGFGAFSGYADPGIRKDPMSNTIYFSYSWPHYEIVGSNQLAGVSSHLAKSVDGGNSWSFIKTLWPAVQMNNPANPSQAGVMNVETTNLLPVNEGGTVTWYAATFNYFLSNNGSGSSIAGNSFHIRVYKAATPEALSTATPSVIGTYSLNAAWGPVKNLAALNASLSGLDFWSEPALYYENGKLYLILVSFDYDNQGVPIMANNAVHVFATTPSGDPGTWTWEYKGKLAGEAEANELGAQRLSQIDIARGKDGRLLMIATPDDWNAAEGDYNHKGCKVLVVKSMDSPALERGTDGKLVVRAIITASDANSLGAAASTYDPASSTGILFTRRNKTATSFTINIWSTGVNP